MKHTYSPSSKILIIGSGVVGAAVADELTQRGARDVTVVDQGPLYETGGSSSHAPGFVFQINPSKAMSELAQRTLEKLDELNPGEEDNWLLKRVGGIELAYTDDQMRELKRRHGFAQSWGVASELIQADDVQQLWPGVDTTDLIGALHTPTDAVVHSVRAVTAQAERAIEHGAVFHGHTRVTDLVVEDCAVTGVQVVDALTGGNERTLAADIVVAAGGIWGPTIGKWLGENMPMQPIEHGFGFSHPMAEFEDAATDESCNFPMIRHQGAGIYFRQQGRSLAIGAYEHKPLEVRQDQLASAAQAHISGVQPSVHEFTWPEYEPTWKEIQRVYPSVREAGLDEARSFNGIFSFTPDGGPLLGPSNTVTGVWIAQAVWVTASAGVAQVVADWITTGEPGIDTSHLDLARFDTKLLSPEFGRQKGLEAYDEVYDIRHPRAASAKLRGIRTSPFHFHQQLAGAHFVEANGWERPLWLEENRRILEEEDLVFPKIPAWDTSEFSPIAVGEAWATRNRVAMYDMTSLARYWVEGPDASALLERLTTNTVSKAPGSVTYTLMLDATGGILSDITVTRISEEAFLIGANGHRDLIHLADHVRDGQQVSITDISPGTCCIGLWGPNARDVLGQLTDDDISHEGFGYFKAKQLYIAAVPVMALRVSYVGELGWELYTTADHGARLWEELHTAGGRYSIVIGGRLAFNALRLEKGFRSYGADVTREHRPAQAGLGFAVSKTKTDYLGCEALSDTPVTDRQMVTLTSDFPFGTPNPGSPVLDAAGQLIGYTASSDFGYTVGKTITFAWLDPEYDRADTEVVIKHFDRSVPALVATDPLYDPSGSKMRR
ncbi:GcvT family protein [Yaniella halotolerans]|uniref:GcvT family protein n=1 Tax=Yaniella halotolerans TaxID=225453 RepID=UPI0004980DA3|nr:FAD-dependent oxidoreductase [Yaniella halotolerans]